MLKRALAILTLAVAALASTVSMAGTDPGPFGETVFVRGGFNDWAAVDAMTWDAVDQEFTAVLSLEAGNWEFKIASEGWDNPDFGPLGDPVVTLGDATDIGTAIGANFMLEIVAAGDYLFTLFDLAEGIAPTSGLLTVTAAVPVPAALLLFGSGLLGLRLFRRRQ